MTNKGAASLHGLAIRVTQLQFDGSHIANSAMYVTDNLVKLDFNPDVEAGTEVSDKNAAGNVAVTFRLPDVIKRLTLSLEIVYPDPELEVLLSGGSTYTTGSSNIMGMQYPALNVASVLNQVNGVSLEVWTHSILNGGIDPTQPYMHWVWPRTFFRKDNRTIDINRMATVFTGYAQENTLWGAGPQSDWVWDSSRVAQWAFASTVPSSVLGAQKSLA